MGKNKFYMRFSNTHTHRYTYTQIRTYTASDIARIFQIRALYILNEFPIFDVGRWYREKNGSGMFEERAIYESKNTEDEEEEKNEDFIVGEEMVGWEELREG